MSNQTLKTDSAHALDLAQSHESIAAASVRGLRDPKVEAEVHAALAVALTLRAVVFELAGLREEIRQSKDQGE